MPASGPQSRCNAIRERAKDMGQFATFRESKPKGRTPDPNVMTLYKTSRELAGTLGRPQDGLYSGRTDCEGTDKENTSRAAARSQR